MSPRPFLTVLVAILLLSGSAVGAPFLVWGEGFGQIGPDFPVALTVDSGGNTLVLGTFTGTCDFGSGPLTSLGSNDIFLAKYAPAGNCLWARAWGGASMDLPKDMALLPDDSVVLTGLFQDTVNFGGGPVTSNGAGDVFLLRIGADGSYVWHLSFGGVDSDYGASVEPTSSGGLVLLGMFQDKVDFGLGMQYSAGGEDLFLISLSGAGSVGFSRTFGTTLDDWPGAVAVDGVDRIYLGATSNGDLDLGGGPMSNAGGQDAFLASFDQYGNYTWSQRYGDSSDQWLTCLATPGVGVVAGFEFEGTIDLGGKDLVSVGGDDIALARFDPAGSHLWSKSFGSGDSDSVIGLAARGDGRLLAVGSIPGPVNFGGGLLPVAGGEDAWCAAFDADGAYLFSGAYGDASDQEFHCAGFSGDHDFYVAGQYRGTIDVGGGPLTSAGFGDVLLARFTDTILPEDVIIADVAPDQGGRVRLTFSRSPLDDPAAAHPVVRYDVYRRIDAVAEKMSGWDFVASVPARGDPEYNLVVETLADSTISGGMHWTVLMLTLATGDPFIFYDAPPDSGYSLDNLSPASPTGLLLDVSRILTWNEATEPDFAYFTVYSSDTPGMTSPTVVGYTVTGSRDVSGTDGSYLAVSATDYAGNESALSPAGQNPSGIADPVVGPATRLLAAAPNPFNPRTSLRFELAERSAVRLVVYDLAGRHVRALLSGETLGPGPAAVVWDGRDEAGQPSSAGVYMYRLDVGGYNATRRVVLVK